MMLVKKDLNIQWVKLCSYPMSIQSVIILILLFIIHTADVTESTEISPSIVDSEIDDENVVIPCLIDRTRWAFPSILQWYRFHDNHTKPIASQFDNYPVHIDDAYRDKYSLLLNSSLNIIRVQLNDNDTFECRLILIDRGLLDIKEKYFVIHRVNEKPRFVNQSNPLQIVPHYSTVNFICQIYGVPVPTVTWYRIIDRDHLEIILNNSQILTLHNADDRMAGKYRCVGQNRLDSIQNDFQLFIRGSIYWRRFPESQSIRINQSLTLQCEGESSEPLQYQWFKDDVPISDRAPSQDRIRTYSDGVLTIQQVEPTDHGSYVCVISATNSVSVRSRPAVISVKYPPTPSRSRETKNLTLIRGSPGLCPCLLDAYPPIQSVSWYRNGIAVRISPKNGGYAINHDYALMIKSVSSDDNGEYYCRAQNSEGFGQASKSFYVVTKEPIKFVMKPKISYSVNEGDSLIVPCVTLGNPQPTIRWFRNSIMLSETRQNLTFHRIEKSDHGVYVCHASNEHTTTNITTSINVENTTPQAPHHIQYRQSGTRLFLSWEAGYDAGRTQYFMIWYRNLNTKKRLWNQIRVLPTNSTEFILFDLKLQQNYELTIVGENELGLGSFSPILTIQLNETDDGSSVGFLHQTNETNIVRPSSPINLRLSYSGSNLYITWNHANQIDSAAKIVHYVLQWRSTILFNNEQSHQSIVLDYPIRSFVVKNIKQSNYIVQLLAYSDRGIYSPAIETQIHIRFNSIFAYSGSNVLLIVLFCFLILLTLASICLCLFCLFKYYYHRRTYSTDLECDSKWICGCFPRLQYRLGDCSHLKVDRYRANLLKSNDLPTTPLYIPPHRLIASTPTVQLRASSPQESTTDSTVSLAKVMSIPRCRDSIVSNTMIPSHITRTGLSGDNLHVVSEDGKFTSFFDTNATDPMSPVPYIDLELRKNAARIPLEVVPEMNELDVANSRYSFDPTSTITTTTTTTVTHPHRSHSAVQPSPMLITFDSSSLKRRN